MALVYRRIHRGYLRRDEPSDLNHEETPSRIPPKGGATREPKEMKAKAMPNCRLRLPSSGYRSAIIAKNRSAVPSRDETISRPYRDLTYRQRPSQPLADFGREKELHRTGQRRMLSSRGKWHTVQYTSECHNQFDQSMHQWMDWLTVEWWLWNRTTFRRPHPLNYRRRPWFSHLCCPLRCSWRCCSMTPSTLQYFANNQEWSVPRKWLVNDWRRRVSEESLTMTMYSILSKSKATQTIIIISRRCRLGTLMISCNASQALVIWFRTRFSMVSMIESHVLTTGQRQFKSEQFCSQSNLRRQDGFDGGLNRWGRKKESRDEEFRWFLP